MGDRLPDMPLSPEIDRIKSSRAVGAAFDPPRRSRQRSWWPTRDGSSPNATSRARPHDTAAELVHGQKPHGNADGAAHPGGCIRPVAARAGGEWQRPDDPRRAIRIADLLRMSSGLRFVAPQDPDFDPARGYPDHLYVYTGAIDAYQWAISRPPQWPPNTVGRYRNSDPLVDQLSY